MAKQRDDQNQPRKKKEEPSDVLPMDDLDVVEEVDDAEVVDLEAVDAGDDAPKTSRPKAVPPKTADDIKKTMLARKGTVPTMLAPQGELEAAGKAATPPPFPDLSVDKAKTPPPAPDEEVLESLEAVPASDVVPRGPMDSDVVDLIEVEAASGARKPDSEVLTAEPLSDVVEITSDVIEMPSDAVLSDEPSKVKKKPASGVVSDVIEMPSDAVLSEEASKVKKMPASDVIEEVEEVPASGVVEMGSAVVLGEDVVVKKQLASDIVEAEEVASSSDIMDVTEIGSEASARELASDIFSAEETAPAKRAKDPSISDADILEDSGVRDNASDIFSAETINLEESPSDKKKKDSEDVLDEVETVATGSSAINWDDVKSPDSAVKESEKTKAGIDLEHTVSFDQPKSGVDRVAEALESGVDLEGARSKKKSDKTHAEAVEFDDEKAAGDDESSVELGGPIKPSAKKSAKIKMSDAETELDVAGIGDLDDLAAADEATEVAEGDKGAPPKGKKKKSAEEEAEDLLLGGDLADEELAAVAATGETGFEDEAPKSKKGKKKAALLDDEALEDETPKGKKKKKRFDDDEGGVATLTKKQPKPKYGRRWMGGILVGLLLAVAGVGAVWFFAPDVLDSLPQSPNAKGPKLDPLAVKANEDRLKGQLADAEKAREDLQADLKKKDAELASARLAADKGAKDLLAKLEAATKDYDAAKEIVEKAQAALVAEKLIAKDDPISAKAVEAAILGLGESSREYKSINEILKKADVKDVGAKGLAELFKKKQEADEQLVAIDKLLEGEKLDGKGAKAVADLLARRDLLAKDRDALKDTVEGAFKVLVDARFLDAKSDARKDLIKGIESARVKAESPLAGPLTSLASGLSALPFGIDRLIGEGVESAAMASKLAFYSMREPLVTGPESTVDLHLLLLQDRSRSAGKDVDTAVREATWLLAKEAKSSPILQAKALYVLGLAQRNQEKYAEARKSFTESLERLKDAKDPGLWANLAKVSLDELTDPQVYYLPRAERFVNEGNPKKALEELETGLKAIPADPRLLVARGLARIEASKGAGTLLADADMIRTDAAAAAKHPDTGPMGVYTLGLLEETLDRATKAEAKYREALALLKDRDDKASAEQKTLVTIALARVLQLDRFDEELPLPKKVDDKKVDEKKVDDKKADDKKVDEKKADDKKADEKKADDKKADEKKADEKVKSDISLSPLQEAAVLLLVALPPFDEEGALDPETTARLKESMARAKELIESDNPKVKGQGYMLLGKAQYKLGERTEGLRNFVKGHRLVNPGKAGEELHLLIEDHPALGYPEAAPRPSRFVAEDHFGRGLHYYWFKQYPEAEASFRQSVHWFPEDARYHYFLGLSQFAQKGDAKLGKRKYADAIVAFQEGSRREHKYAASEEVNQSLERIQGDLRRLLNRYRESAVTAPLDDKGGAKTATAP